MRLDGMWEVEYCRPALKSKRATS